MPDGSTTAVNSDDGWAAIEAAWYWDNPDAEVEPELQYPVDLVWEDGLTETISNDDEMDRAARGARDERDRGEGLMETLIENGIARENVEGVMGTLRLIIAEIQSEGEAFELDPAIYDELVSMGLTVEQVESVVNLARCFVGDEEMDLDREEE